MRVTLFGALTLVGIAALLVYAGYEFYRTSQANALQPRQNPNSSINP
jgi:hypothetical protein